MKFFNLKILLLIIVSWLSYCGFVQDAQWIEKELDEKYQALQKKVYTYECTYLV